MNIAGVILAGGKSSRMGTDKSKLYYRDNTLLRHTENLLKNTGIENVYINNEAGISDEIKDKGPLGGVHTTLKELQGKFDYLLYVPVDMPNLQVPLLQRLMDTPPNNDIVCFENHTLPFRLKMNTKWIDVIENIFNEEEDYSLKNFHKKLNFHALPTNPLGVGSFANINTPDDWEKYTRGKS